MFQVSLGCGSSVKQKIKICQDGKIHLSTGQVVKIKSPNRSLYSHIDCDWKIWISKNCRQPIFTCDQFDMEFSRKCSQNYLELLENEVKVRYCGLSENLEYKVRGLIIAQNFTKNI